MVQTASYRPRTSEEFEAILAEAQKLRKEARAAREFFRWTLEGLMTARQGTIAAREDISETVAELHKQLPLHP